MIGDLLKFILLSLVLVVEMFWKSCVLIVDNVLVMISEVLVGLFLGVVLGGLFVIGLVVLLMVWVLVRLMLVFS